jgi:hypothetical protein
MKALILLLAVAACTDTRKADTRTQSIQVELVSPADPGTIGARLPDTARTVSLKLTALGFDGQPDTTFNRSLQVYIQFLGTLSPYINDGPLTTVQMSNGTGTLSNFMLPPVFGPTVVWFEDGCYQDFTGSATAPCANGGPFTYATGSSPTLWFRDPFIFDIRYSETLPDPFGTGPIDSKNVTVLGEPGPPQTFSSRYGALGRLVITSKYAQGYTLADVKCQDSNGTPPCDFTPPLNAAGQPLLPTIDGFNIGYDSIDIYSYSAPLDQEKRFLNEGQTVDGFSGGVSEFDGLLEIGFPQTFVNCTTGSANCPDVNVSREPPPVKVDPTWFTNPALFKRFESHNVEIDNAAICNLDSAYDQYKEWHLDLSGTGGNCTGNLVDVVSAGIFDPTPYIGMKLPKIIGNERSINIGTFHVFIIYPRSMADITLP